MAEDQGERTEEATQQRREEFRKRGQVAQTRELASALMLFGSVLAVWLLGRFFLMQFFEVFNRTYTDFFLSAARSGDWSSALWFAVEKIALLTLPLLGVLWSMSFASTVVQVGFLYNEEALDFDFERLNPVEGLKRILSLKAFAEGLKALMKLIIISTIVYFLIRSELREVPRLVEYGMDQVFVYLGGLVLKLLGGVGGFMAVLAGGDYLFQRWDLEKKMRMTKQELKEEIKSREGDPLIKSRIRRIQRELANKRMMNDVPKADVIVTNPTHIAVAIKYDETMVAPRVLAKGAGVIAERIRAIAKEHGIPLVENKPLARTMFKTVKIGQLIPRELYTAVAEVLSFVYRLRRRGGR